MFENETYSQFIAWLDKGGWHLPPSPYLFPSIKAFFTIEEAELLTQFPFQLTELKELARLKGYHPDHLRKKLDALAQKGVLWRTKKEDGLFYKLNNAFFIFFRGPFYAYHIDQRAKAMATPLNLYVRNGLMDQLAPVNNKPLRTIPIRETIADPRHIASYEDAIKIVDSQEYLAVSNCACKQRKKVNFQSHQCTYPQEVCLHFGGLAHYLVENNLSREISKEEAKEILKAAAEAGLVQATSNRQKDVDTICNCCPCCCVFFESYHILKHEKSHDFSNYLVRTNSETCKGCGLCVQRCPVKALALEKSSLVSSPPPVKYAKLINPHLCLGCGVCVYKCPTRSLFLEPRGEIKEPPKDAQEWMTKMLADQKKAQAI